MRFSENQPYLDITSIIYLRSARMNKPPLEILSDIATEAHTQIQKNFADINPVVSVNRKMRTAGIPADAMTIDCLKSSKRILIVLHDQQPETLNYQFGYKDKDPENTFTPIPISELSTSVMYEWISEYFS